MLLFQYEFYFYIVLLTYTISFSISGRSNILIIFYIEFFHEFK